MSELFDRFDTPSFDNLDADAAWAACEDFTDWMYENAGSFSEAGWDEVLRISTGHYAEYYRRYENA